MIAAGLLSTVASCSKTINDLSSTAYSEHRITSKQFIQSGLALLPVRVNAGKEPEAKFIDSALEKELSRKIPGIKLVGPGKLGQFKKDSMEGKWVSTMVQHASPYTIRGVDGIQLVSRKLGVRYFLQTDIRISGVEGGAEHVRIYGRLWDGMDKEIIWSGYGEARGYVYGFFPVVPAPFEKDADVAVKGLVRQMDIR
ncbi:MAG: hypothetical protein ACYCYP_00910 [Leptospirales bacterium]